MRPVVLFVDDEPNILSGLKRSMRVYAQQWEILFCSSGDEALRIIEAAAVDVLVTDMRMPGMDGAQLLETVSLHWPGLYRLALSGEADLETSCRIVGRSHRFLSKPCAPELIYQAIQGPLNLNAENADFEIERGRTVFDRIKANPGSFARLQALADSTDPTLSDVAAVIMGDPSIAVRILQIVNSAYFGRPYATHDIARAVKLLGLARIFSLFKFNRLGIEHENAADRLLDASRHAQAALTARAQTAQAGGSPEQMSTAYSTALFADLAQDGSPAAGGQTGAAKLPAYVCALFGLPDPLVQSMLRLSAQRADCSDATQLGALAAHCAMSPDQPGLQQAKAV